MGSTFDRRMYCLLSDGVMHYPVFAEVRRGGDLPDVATFVQRVAATYHVDPEALHVVSYPRWAIEAHGDDGHAVHVGMIPASES